MTTNINFNLGRLMAVTKRDLMENWKTNLYRILGCYSAIAFGFLIFMIGKSSMYGISDEAAYQMICGKYQNFLMIFLSIYVYLSASKILEVTDSKEKRISYMMLPATTGEKFVSRVLYVTVVSMLIFFVSLFLAELTRLILLPLFDTSTAARRFMLPDMITGIFSFDTSDPSTICAQLASNVWMHSIFILGGCWFRKNPFVKTFGLFMGIVVILGMVLTTFMANETGIIKEWLMYMVENHS